MPTAEPSSHPARVAALQLAALRPLERGTCPAPLRPLWDLSWNFWWTWDQPTRSLFEQIEPRLWESTRHNPVRTLAGVGTLAPERLAELASDDSFVERVGDAAARFRSHMEAPASPGLADVARGTM